MATKANNHPLIRDLRRVLQRHNLKGALLLGITNDGDTITASAGNTVKACDALGPILNDVNVDLLYIEMSGALRDV